ncbi:MAG: hypothetical protein ABW277_14665 [Longimicrobiaceae bacterium]
MRRARLVLALVPACAATPAAAQRAPADAGAAPAYSVGVSPDTVTVGDRFRVHLRAVAPPGTRVEFPARLDSLPVLHPVGPPRGPSDPATGDFAAAYPMVAWRPGALPPLLATVRVTAADGRTATVRVPLRLPFVRSVLPADTAKVEPRGPHDVLGPDWDRRLMLVLVLLALLLLAPTAVFVRRWLRKRLARGPAPPVDPRARALASLELARRMRLVEAGDWKRFYTLTSEALRGYLDALSPRWGADLTTEELARALDAADVDADDARAVGALLAEADAVKFAGAASSPAAAERHWQQAREWVASFDRPAPTAEGDESDAHAAAEVGR